MEQQQTPKKITKKKIFTIIGAIIVAYVGYELYQMNKGDHYKFLLQTELDRQYRDWGRGSFCYVIGSVKLPYIEKGYPDEYWTQRKELNNDASRLSLYPDYNKYENLYILHTTLPIFYNLGLLNRQKVEGTDYYQYDISDEGKKYQSTHDSYLTFCYGHQKVIEITDVTKHDSTTYKGSELVKIDYNYQVDDIPDWVINKDFAKLYFNTTETELNKENLKNKRGRQTLIEKKGKFYIDARFNLYLSHPNVDKYLSEKQ